MSSNNETNPSVMFIFWFLNVLVNHNLYRGQVARLASDNFTYCHKQDSGETMTSVSAGHIILTATQPVGIGQLRRVSNPGLPHQESRALPTQLPPLPPPPPKKKKKKKKSVMNVLAFSIIKWFSF